MASFCIPEGYDDGQYNGLLSSCVLSIAEVGNSDTSLDCVLEVMRQSTDFFDYYLGDSSHEVFVPTLYKLAGHRLDKLERRPEIIEWFREVLNFCIEHVAEVKAVDNTIAASVICDLIDLQAVELLPEINALFDTEMVDLCHCGRRSEVLNDIVNPDYSGRLDDCILYIHQRFDDLQRKFDRR